jgi:hypothetical protein
MSACANRANERLVCTGTGWAFVCPLGEKGDLFMVRLVPEQDVVYATVDEGRTFQRLENGIPSCETNEDRIGVLKRALLEWKQYEQPR